MANVEITVHFHEEADPGVVNSLVAACAATLVSAVDVNREARGVGKAYYIDPASGYILSAFDQAQAVGEGLSMPTPYGILGVPIASELGAYIMAHQSDPDAIDVTPAVKAGGSRCPKCGRSLLGS